MGVTTFDLLGPLPTGTAVLEASAGTGKTFAIAALAARFVASGRPLRDLMLVTFSRSASAELRTRVRQRLEQAERAVATGAAHERDEVGKLLCTGDPATLARRQQLLASALTEFDQATIATTHEFCGRMLAGLGVLGPATGYQRFVPDLAGLVRETAFDAWVARSIDPNTGSVETTPAATVKLAKQVLAHDADPLGPDDATGTAAERVALARAIRALAHQRKRTRGLSTYDDMMGLLLEALTDPEVGELACARLAARFPVVLIDEFQDTDPQQWRIIERAFVGRSAVILIGDPKQAIYAFRGADVRSYLEAVARAEKTSLGVNHRSDERLVSAVGGLLSQAALGHPEISVTPVTAAVTRSRLVAPPGSRWEPPVRIRELVDDSASAPPIPTVRRRIADDLVDDISRLLASDCRVADDGPDGDEVLRAVRPDDIAVLVQSNARGAELQRRLALAGVPAVFMGTQSVFASEAAQDWLWLLRALADTRPPLVRQVGLTAFHGWDFPALATASSPDLTQLGAKVRGWATTLRERGVPALVEEVLGRGDVIARVLGRSGGERLLTDLRHIGEALARAEASGVGIAGLPDWLEAQMRQPDSDDSTRRVESEGGAVRLMTIHRAKGLQFPLVYLPDVADRWVPQDEPDAVFVVHDAEGRRVLDVAGGAQPLHRRREQWQRHLEEEAGEDLRKLYVGLTRAQSQVTMWWSRSQANTIASPLHRVLFRRGSSEVALAYDEDDLDGVEMPAGVARQRVTGPGPSLPAAVVVGAEVGEPPVLSSFDRSIDHQWRRTSYTGLTAGAHGLAPGELGMREVDEPAESDADALAGGEVTPDGAGQPVGTPSPLSGMPGGTQFGSLVHAVLEELDPTADDLPAALLRVCTRLADRIPVPGLAPDALATGLLPVVQTPLGPLAGGRRLADIAVPDRLAELDFEMPLGGGALVADLADLVAEHLPADDPLAAYPTHLRAAGLGEQTLRGFLTGSIDAVLRVGAQPRHLVVDYKTNRVGPLGAELTLEHYTTAAMARAMIDSHYPLQALLYCVALHRFLRWRLAGYEPDTHLGGVLYLFLRGMGGEPSVRDSEVLGVFSWSPPPALVVALSDRIGGQR